MQFQRILVRATNWVGDAVMSVPALQALREAHPQAHIAILARPWVSGLYGREPFCDELIPYEAPKGWHGLGAKWGAARKLRSMHFDCAVLLQNAFESAALVRAAGIPVRIGYDRDARGWLLTKAIPVPKKGDAPPHQRFYYLELLKRAGLIGSDPNVGEIRLHGAHAAAEQGRRLFHQHGVDQPVVGVSPGAAYGGAKRWPADRFSKAAVAVARERHAAVAVFGSEQESEICRTVERAVHDAGIACYNFAGKTPLSAFIEMAAACEVYLTNDSGPMHIASAMGVPTVAVFGATDHIATGPTGDLSVVVREPVDCSPCLLRECPIDHRCMTRVSPKRVADAALTLVALEKK